jgi:hypothetical protein
VGLVISAATKARKSGSAANEPVSSPVSQT